MGKPSHKGRLKQRRSKASKSLPRQGSSDEAIIARKSDLKFLVDRRTPLKKRIKAAKDLMRHLSKQTLLLDKKPVESLCEIGCYQCCYRMPYIRTHLEETYLKWALRKILMGSPKTEEKLSQKVLAAYSVWMDLCQAEGMKPEKPGSPSSLESAWVETTTPCTLLDLSVPSPTCVVYPFAPLDCRVTHRPKEAFGTRCLTPTDAPALHVFHENSPINYALGICQKIDAKTGDGHYDAKPLIEVLKWAIR